MDDRHLKNAPIVEALINFEVEPSLPSVAGLASLRETVRAAGFTEERPIVEFKGHIKFEDTQASVDPVSSHLGHVFYSSDRRRALQLRTNGFSFSHLKPYDRWETLREDARTLWRQYVSNVAPTTVKRIGLRYINRLELPMPMDDFSSYLTTFPVIGKGAPQQLASIFMRVAMPVQSRVVVLTEATEEKGVTESLLPLIFDIDIFTVGSFSPDGSELWSELDEMRQLKNDVFFNSLTERTLETYR